MTDELKLCPFCGGEAEACMYVFTDGAWVVCPTCHISTADYSTKDEAINAWNTRAERTCTLDGSHSINYGYAPVGTVWEWDLSCGHHIEMDDCPDYCPYCGAKVVDKS